MAKPSLPVSQRDPHLNRRIWRIAGPAILANSSGPLVGLVDAWAIGRISAPEPLAAVGLGGFVFSFIYWGFGFLRMGTTGLIAQASGRDDPEEMARIMLQSFALALAIAVIMQLLRAPVIFGAFALFAPAQALGDLVRDYIEIRYWSIPLVLLKAAVLGFLIGIQRTQLALVVELVLNIANAALSVLFVVGFGWGVKGVAGASLLAEVLATSVGMVIVLRILGVAVPDSLRRGVLWRWAAYGRLLSVNFFLFIRTLFLLAAFAIVYRTSVGFGALVLAANQVLLTFTSLIAFGLDALAYAAEALVGQAIGKGDRRTLDAAIKATSAWAFAVSVLYSGFFWLAGSWLIGVLHVNPAVQATAEAQLPLLIILPMVAVASYQMDGVFIGATRSDEMMWTMVLSFALFAGLVAWLVPSLDNRGLWYAFLGFLAARGVSLILRLPALYKKVESTNSRHSDG